MRDTLVLRMYHNFVELVFHFGSRYVTDFYTRASTVFAKEYFNGGKICVVEIGTFQGYNAWNILKNLHVDCFFVVDPYTTYEDIGIRVRDCYFDKARRRLSKYPVVFRRMFSSDAVSQIPDDIDFIYIDGNHTYDFVKKDIELYYPKVRAGGILGGHDYNGQYPDVIQAVSEFIMDNDLLLHTGGNKYTGYDWWVVKDG